MRRGKEKGGRRTNGRLVFSVRTAVFAFADLVGTGITSVSFSLSVLVPSCLSRAKLSFLLPGWKTTHPYTLLEFR